MKQNKRVFSLTMLTASMLIFGTVGVFRTYISVSSLALAWIRGVTGALFLAAASLLRGKKLLRSTSKKDVLWLLLSGAAIGLNWVLLFESFNYTSVSVGTLFYYTEPTLVILFSVFLFREKMTRKKAICTAAALVGMVLISGVTEGGISPDGGRGIALAFGAALLYTGVVLLNKKVSGVDAYDKTIIQMAAAALVLVPFLIAEGLKAGAFPLPTEPREVLLSVAMGILHTGIAYALYFGSMDDLEARTVALFSYIDPVTALILSALLLGESLSVWGILGAVLIIGAAAVSEFWPERRKN